LFFSGVRPAMNVGLSVSRVGGAAQTPALRKVAGMLRLDLAYYNELQAFAQFATELDKATRAQLSRGERMVELLKQPQYQPLSMAEEVVVIYAGTQGYTDALPVARVAPFGRELLPFVRESHPGVLESLRSSGRLEEAAEQELKQAIADFLKIFTSAPTPEGGGSS
jgi:F-type H+-transporting ATPase subunit alpha